MRQPRERAGDHPRAPFWVLLVTSVWLGSTALAQEGASAAQVEYVDENGEAVANSAETVAEAETETETETTTVTEAEVEPGWQLDFVADEDLRVRAAIDPDEVDVDGRLYLDARVMDPGDSFGAEAALGMWSDFDGVNKPEDPTGFAEIHEPRSLPIWVDVYSLAARYQDSGLVRSARAGRLVVQHGLPVTLDGAAIELAPLGHWLELFAFGGRSVHFFEVEQELFEDWVAALGVATQPMPGLKLELDYSFHVEDTDTENGLMEHGYGLTAWYRLGGWFGARLNARGLDDRLSHLGGALRGGWPEQDLGVELSVKTQLIELHELAELADPYFATLGHSDPNLRWRLDAYKGFETELGVYALHLGGDGRQLLRGETSTFNRNFGRLYLMATAHDIVVDGPFLTLAFERHSVGWDFVGQGLWTLSGSAGYAAGDLRAELGSRYDSYKYTYYSSVDEIQDVRTVYAEARYRIFDLLSLRARYQFERFAWDVHTVRVGLAQVF